VSRVYRSTPVDLSGRSRVQQFGALPAGSEVACQSRCNWQWGTADGVMQRSVRAAPARGTGELYTPREGWSRRRPWTRARRTINDSEALLFGYQYDLRDRHEGSRVVAVQKTVELQITSGFVANKRSPGPD